jgi:hypothetical protein
MKRVVSGLAVLGALMAGAGAAYRADRTQAAG